MELQIILLGWCFWLLGVWGVALRMAPTGAAVRWMIMLAVVGLMLVWPAVRLSLGGRRPQHGMLWDDVGGEHRQPLTGDAPSLILVEWLCLMLIFQAVVWPVRWVAHWSFEQAAWVDAAVAAWSLVAALLVAVGVRLGRGLARAAVMLLAVALVVVEPLLVAATVWGGDNLGRGWTMRVTPLQAVWQLAGPAASFKPGDWPMVIVSVGVAAFIGWILLLRLSAKDTGA